MNSIKHLHRQVLAFLVATLVGLGVALPARAADSSTTPRTTAGLMQPENPTCMLIGYTAKAENRAAFRAYLKNTAPRQLDQWQAAGIFQSYQIIFQNFAATNAAPDAVLILTFKNFEDTYKWVEIENEMPGGLSAAGLALAQPVYNVLAERLAHHHVAGSDPAPKVFEVSLYDIVTKDKNEYKKFVTEYPVAMFEDWIKQGAVAEYTVYLPLQAYGHPWDSMIVLGYKDAAAHSGSGKTKIQGYKNLAQDVPYNSQMVKRDMIRKKVNECFYHNVAVSR